MKRKRPLILCLLFSLFMAGCTTVERRTSWEPDDYFSYYGVEHLAGERSYGFIGEGEDSLWTWSVTPPEVEGTVLFLHGYLDHSALSSRLLTFLNREKYRIVTYDLPGHGLSGGQRAGMDNFDEYRESLSRVMAYWHLEPEEIVFIGHSTGGAVVLDRLLSGQKAKGAVLAAPLIRFNHFKRAAFLLNHLPEKVGSLKTSKRPTTSDREFTEKKRRDPLGIERMPVNWPRALIVWEKALPDGPAPVETPLLVVQGGKDRVVAYEDNTARISLWFPRAVIKYYPGLKHHILNEADSDELYGDMERFLESLE